MRRILSTIAILLFFLPAQSRAEDYPVVVELFTAQGCSACPPADAFLAELARRDDVIPLALHVDYWDYLGWPDSFANPAFSDRQRAYARAAGRRTIFTPQMIIQGTEDAIGSRIKDVLRLISSKERMHAPVKLDVERQGDVLTISLQAENGVGPCVVQLVRYDPMREVVIRRGENAGLRLRYTNVVTEWRPILKWDGNGSITVQSEIRGPQPVVVVVQHEGYGPILAARVLR